MIIKDCIAGYCDKSKNIFEEHATKQQFQEFHSNNESVKELWNRICAAERLGLKDSDRDIVSVCFMIEDDRLPENTVLDIYLDFGEDEIDISLLIYDDPCIQLQTNRLWIGSIYGDPLPDDGKRFFFEDLEGIVADYAKDATETYDKEKKGEKPNES